MVIKLKENIPVKASVLLFTFKAKPQEFLMNYSISELEDGLKEFKKIRRKTKSAHIKVLHDLDISYLERYIQKRKRESV